MASPGRQLSEELSLDGALKYDGRDVGAALPSEVWVTSGSKRTFRAWSEGNTLRVAAGGDAAAAPSGAVVVQFRTPEVERDVLSGARSFPAALASGGVRVRGDVHGLRPAAERIAKALLGDARVAVSSVAVAGGVAYYVVAAGPRRAERRYSEFCALRSALLRVERRGAAARVLRGAPFPSKVFGGLEARRAALDGWLRRVACCPALSEKAAAHLDAFLGDALAGGGDDDEAGALAERVLALERRVAEPEECLSQAIAALIVLAARCYGAFVVASTAAFLAFVARRGFRGTSAALSACTLFLYGYRGAHRYNYRIPSVFWCLHLWRLARWWHGVERDEDDHLDAFTRSLLASTERAFLERLSVRVIADVTVLLAKMDRGLLVKMGQVVSNQRGFLADEFVEPLALLCDAMPAMAPATARRRARGAPAAVRGALGDRDLAKPVASASIAQVHRVAVGGGEVAVKIQKAGVRHVMYVDMCCLKVIAKILMALEPATPDLGEIVENQYQNLLQEMDFEAEARALGVARAALAARGSEAVVPEALYTDDVAALRSGVLCMRWCTGDRIDVAMAKHDLKGAPLQRCIDVLVDAHATLLFHGGVVNMDPHPGNILVDVRRTAGGEVAAIPVLLDWGMHEIMPDAQRLGIARLVDCLLRAAVDELPAALKNLGVETHASVPAATIFEHLEFAFRRSTTNQETDLEDIDSFLKDSQKGIDDIKEKLKGEQEKAASGFKPLLSTFRALDLLHGYVMGLPVTVDFLGIYAKRAREAANEATRAGS